ncbi:DUF3489 domain-containing protein, partial [Sansalvadorimonas sp. 2012CJ34-2]
RSGSKLHQVIQLLSRPEGATILQVAEQTGWQQHTIRGTLSGVLKKRLGLVVESTKLEGVGRVYRIISEVEAS